MKSLANAKAEPIGHLGFVGGVLQDTEIMAKIDEQLGEVTGGLNYGYRVGAML